MNDRYAVQRIMEIISFVMSELRQHRPLNDIDMGELHRRGYTDGEISAALSWIMERSSLMMGADEATPPQAGSYRILHGIEHDVMSVEAWGALISYRDVGLLTPTDVENVLERVLVMGSEQGVTDADIQSIIAAYLMHQQPSIQSGSRTLLDGSETIN
ncbi:MAG: DUF494 family protein [Candidatus Kapabacteria bacterium]|jgi:uncharacterized protein Smg (DUF494 family)|nr:DUF494 family protein [Candidatus Kapabacteria bacterium]